jgi:adenylate kinase family enzyme
MTKKYEKMYRYLVIRMQPVFPDSPLRRILILGPSGSGKSTLGKRIGRILGIPAVHLDMHFWNPNWVETPKDEWHDKVKKLIASETWVMDGNYTSTLKMRTDVADTIIFLDMTRRLSYFRVVSRYLRNRGKTRPDVTEGCPEKIDMEFIKWIWDYPRIRKPATLRFLEKLRASKNVYFLYNQKEIEEFLKSLRISYRQSNQFPSKKRVSSLL